MSDLFQNPRLLTALLTRMHEGLAILDANQVNVFVNDALCKMTGFAREELVGTRAPFPYWPPEELLAIEALVGRLRAGEEPSTELVLQRKDGSRFCAIVSAATLRDEAGERIASFTTIKDISERKQLQSAMRESEQRWRSITENPFDFVSLIDRDYRFTYVNHTAPGITRESLIGRATPFDVVDPQHHQVMREAFEATFETARPTSYDVYSPQLDAWYSNIVGPVLEQGRVASLSILTRDITKQKRAEEALRRSEHRLRESHKMETIGTLAGGIAHDLNNMLTPILAYTDISQRSLAAGHAVQANLLGIKMAALRARELVRRVLLFSRRQEPRKRVFDLRDGVREDVKLLEASLPVTIQIVTELPAEPVHVLADRGQLDQVLTNLATNAAQAMQETGGKLVIALRQAEGTEQEATGLPGVDPEMYAVLSVTDSGPGMDEETQRRAFEPFFTTKPTGSGTGLGLSIVQGIVLDHGGEVSVESVPGRGAVFTVRLPLVPAHLARTDSGRPLQAPTGQHLRVLCVDDERAIVQVAREALTRVGHEVTATTSAPEALALFEKAPDAFDVLVTDQTMPLMTGTALIGKLRALRPTLACVLMTGLDDEDTESRARDVGIDEILGKPFLIDELRLAVDRACEGRRGKQA